MATVSPNAPDWWLRVRPAVFLLGFVGCGQDYSTFRLYEADGDGGTAEGGRGGSAEGGGVAADAGGTSAGGGNGAGGSGGAAGSPPTCDSLYGAAPEYLLCAETATSCRFLRNSSPARTCETVCSTYGGTCIDADNGDPGSCTISGDADCTTSLSSSICVCSRP